MNAINAALQALRTSICGVLVGACVASCSISPQPEPPNPRGSSIDPCMLTHKPTKGPGFIQGAPGAVSPAGATLRGFNLDSTSPSVDTIVAADGSFSLTQLSVVEGDEVRLQLILPSPRSAPVDALVGAANGALKPSVRPLAYCLQLDPPEELLIDRSTVIKLHNACSQVVTLQEPNWRVPVDGLSVGTTSTWPVDLQPGEDLSIALQGIPPVALEEILFLHATAPVDDRRPITVRYSP